MAGGRLAVAASGIHSAARTAWSRGVNQTIPVFPPIPVHPAPWRAPHNCRPAPTPPNVACVPWPAGCATAQWRQTPARAHGGRRRPVHTAAPGAQREWRQPTPGRGGKTRLWSQAPYPAPSILASFPRLTSPASKIASQQALAQHDVARGEVTTINISSRSRIKKPPDPHYTHRTAHRTAGRLSQQARVAGARVCAELGIRGVRWRGVVRCPR